MEPKLYSLIIIITKPRFKNGFDDHDAEHYVELKLVDGLMNTNSERKDGKSFQEGINVEVTCSPMELIAKLRQPVFMSVLRYGNNGAGVVIGKTSFEWPEEMKQELLESEFCSYSHILPIKLETKLETTVELDLIINLQCKCEDKQDLRIDKNRFDEEMVRKRIEPNDCFTLMGDPRLPTNQSIKKCDCRSESCYEAISMAKKRGFDRDIIGDGLCHNYVTMENKNSHRNVSPCEQIFGEETIISDTVLESCSSTKSDSNKLKIIHCYNLTKYDFAVHKPTCEVMNQKKSGSCVNNTTSENILQTIWELTQREKSKNDCGDNKFSDLYKNLYSDDVENVTKVHVELCTTSCLVKDKEIKKKHQDHSTNNVSSKMPVQRSICNKYVPQLSRILRNELDQTKLKKNEMNTQKNYKRDSRNIGSLNKTTDLIPKKELPAKRELMRYMKKKYAKRYFYNPCMKYPGVILGHRDCANKGSLVPQNMGWLWSTETDPDRRGWRPGAIRKPIKALMSHFLKEFPIDTIPVSSKLIGKENSKRNEDYIDDEMTWQEEKPTLSVKKRDGQYLVTMRPVKGPDIFEKHSDPNLKENPIQFTICKYPELMHEKSIKAHLASLGYKKCCCKQTLAQCFCRNYEEKLRIEKEVTRKCRELNINNIFDNLNYSESMESSESELDLEFTPPVALKRSIKKPVDSACKDTQYEENDFALNKSVNKFRDAQDDEVQIKSKKILPGETCVTSDHSSKLGKQQENQQPRQPDKKIPHRGNGKQLRKNFQKGSSLQQKAPAQRRTPFLDREQKAPAQSRTQFLEREQKAPAQRRTQFLEREQKAPAQRRTQFLEREQKAPAQRRTPFLDREQKAPAQRRTQFLEREQKARMGKNTTRLEEVGVSDFLRIRLENLSCRNMKLNKCQRLSTICKCKCFWSLNSCHHHM